MLQVLLQAEDVSAIGAARNIAGKVASRAARTAHLFLATHSGHCLGTAPARRQAQKLDASGSVESLGGERGGGMIRVRMANVFQKRVTWLIVWSLRDIPSLSSLDSRPTPRPTAACCTLNGGVRTAQVNACRPFECGRCWAVSWSPGAATGKKHSGAPRPRPLGPGLACIARIGSQKPPFKKVRGEDARHRARNWGDGPV